MILHPKQRFVSKFMMMIVYKLSIIYPIFIEIWLFHFGNFFPNFKSTYSWK
ncbi:hypothetical protein LEP1GSC083_4961 [Leptospira interrogans serovar Pyrogenes str. L0374]|uniref:Uncharacterized protein n=2 Tax=Leptospira interrogans serovar Pyrogenes TaxID=280500 RepID=M6ZTZ5_LEPIR|nr:hypothetical protein LEP1GSC077_0812 [Leptospira interrogans str. C10069]EMN32685.1 hypothetical protein LEP1GSC083_4961 [Leptospira interrogans serovar Pyrogenes str. L0374]EMN61754.1 hypothetical protein LEP1GSC092_0873 [Leptospira interrogans serovar Pyrogenes str. R168]EMP05240.1 hypothetical protein LEP1GSC124_1756 [Leptospira interrogans serovar Pyrogenes str. 200701872]